MRRASARGEVEAEEEADEEAEEEEEEEGRPDHRVVTREDRVNARRPFAQPPGPTIRSATPLPCADRLLPSDGERV